MRAYVWWWTRLGMGWGWGSGSIREGCVQRLMPLSSYIAPSRPCQTVYILLCKLPSTPNCITQVLIVGGLPGHFRLDWESLKEWGGGGEARGAWRPQSGFRWRLGGGGVGAESAASRASVCSSVCQRGWGACPRRSVSAGASGCRRTLSELSSFRKRGEWKACRSQRDFCFPELGGQASPLGWMLQCSS